ncbi:MAG: AAA family ATPase [Leptospirillia bacterium]
MFDLRLFGPPGVLSGGQPVGLHKKHLALLTFLAMETGKSLDRPFLASTFWPGSPADRSGNSLRQALNSLRTLFDIPGGPPLFSPLSPPFLPELRPHVRLNPDSPIETDVSRLLQPPPSCAIFHDPEDCPSCEVRLLRGIRDIGGPFMDGFSLPGCEEFEVWIAGRREELQVRVRWSVNRLVRLYEKRGTPHEALAVLSGALAMDPLDEACHGRKMLLLAETGNTMAALEQYEICRKALRSGLDMEPDVETRAILEKVRTHSQNPPLSRPALRGPLFPDLAFSPEWRPATALYIELPNEGGEEAFSELPPEVEAALNRATKRAEEMGGTSGRREARSALFWFGISGQAEGAARRAARAALAIRGLMEEIREKRGRRIPFVIGIHAGRILRGSPGVSPDPTGTVSRAAMALSMQAECGTILVSQSASRLLKGQFLLGEAWEIRVLGQRTKGFLLQGETGGDKEGKEDSDASPLFGRERDLATLRDLWRKNRGGLLVVEGEAGIGKSALVRAFVAQPMAREAFLRKVECFPQSMESPFYPVVRMLRGPAGIPEGMEAETAYPILLSYVRSLSLPGERSATALLGSFFSLPAHPDFPLPELPLAGLREETAKLLLSILKARSRKGRVLFLIEDLHWTDASTGDLFRRILSDPVFTKSVFFLLTTRTGEDPPWLATLPERVTLRLSPLGEEESREMVRALTLAAPLPEGEVSRILAAADGVPLFLEELTRERLEAAGDGSPSTLPSTLSEVLASRLDRLDGARLLLQRAALYGRTVPMDLLRALSPEPRELFDALLDRALLSGLVGRESDPSGEIFAFRHALIAEASIQTLAEPNRRLLHRQIGEILRDRFPDRAAATPEIVARHFESAGEFSLALSWFERALGSALSSGFLPEAARLSRKALEVISLCSPEPDLRSREIRLLVKLGTLLIDMEGRGSPEGERTIKKACSLAESGAAMKEETFYAFYNLWDSRYGKADIRASRDMADSLLGLVERSYHRDFRIASLHADGSTAYWEGRFHHSLETLDRAIVLGEDAGTGPEARSSVREALDYRLWTLWSLGRYRSARLLADRLLEGERSSDINRKKGHLLTFVMVLFRHLGLPDRVLEIADNLQQAILTMKIPAWSGSERAFRGWAMVKKGDPGGLALVLQGLRLARVYHRIAENKYLPLLAECWLLLGEPKKAAGVAMSGLRFSKKSGATFYDAELWRLWGEAVLLEGARDEAGKCFETALDISRRQGARALELRALTSLVRLFDADGRKERAREFLERLSGLIEDPEADPSLPDIREAIDIRKRLS